jgi:hypothetical protein
VLEHAPRLHSAVQVDRGWLEVPLAREPLAVFSDFFHGDSPRFSRTQRGGSRSCPTRSHKLAIEHPIVTHAPQGRARLRFRGALDLKRPFESALAQSYASS